MYDFSVGLPTESTLMPRRERNRRNGVSELAHSKVDAQRV